MFKKGFHGMHGPPQSTTPNQNFVKPQMLLILNLRISKYFEESVVDKDQNFKQKFYAVLQVLLPESDGNTPSLKDKVLKVNYYRLRQLFYYKITQKFITKGVSFFILKCDNVITKFGSYYKMRRFYSKMRQLLQNATFKV